MMLSQGRAAKRLVRTIGRCSLPTVHIPWTGSSLKALTPENYTSFITHSTNLPIFRHRQFSRASAAPIEAENDNQSKKQERASFVPTPVRKYEFFQNVEITDSGVAMIRFDCLGKSVNSISFALADESKKLWSDEIENNYKVKAVVFASAKLGTFIVGADIYDIQKTENKQDLIPVIENGLKFFQRIRSKGVPLVAAIDGPALGGGLEWALWCDYRICTDNSKTKVRMQRR